MNQLLLISSSRGPRAVDLSDGKYRLIGIISILATIGLLLASGYFLGRYLVPDGKVGGADAWRSSLITERQNIESMSEQMTNDINALALNLGRMEARSIRLDALGSRLIALAGLGEDEFDFTGTPAVGGPEDNISSGSSHLPGLLDRFTELQRRIDDRQDKLLLLESILMDRELSEQMLPTGRPVKSGWLSSSYGNRIDPFTGKPSWHSGVDFAGQRGADVVAVASGIVIWAQSKHDFGLMVEISHGNGYATRYAHNSELLVAAGDKVEKGETIAKMGSTGRSTGSHVHFEVLKGGNAINPRKYTLGADIQ